MELFADQPGDDGLPGAQRRLAMIAVMTATTMAVLDGTIINVALPSIAEALRVPPATAIWVVNGYLLAAAMTLMTFAALASRFGFRTLFVSGVSVFTVASLGCALSDSLAMLTTMRVLQGIGGAATLSIGPAIYRTVFPTRLLGRMLGLNALVVAASTAIGPTVGGTLLAFLSWPWLFAINIPLGIIGVVLGLRAIPQAPVASRSGGFDVAGAALSALGMGALILAADACAELRQGTDAALRAGLYALLALVAGGLFIWRQRYARQPLLPLDIFGSTRFSLAALCSLAAFVAQGIMIISLPFLFQNAYGYGVFHAALLFTAWPLGIVLAAPHAGKLADRYPAALLSTVGLGVFTLGLALLAVLPDTASTVNICWRELVCGIGFGIFQSPNNREMLSNVSRERSGSASGILAVVRTFGQCFGAAVVGIVLSVYAAASLQAPATATQDAQAMAVAIGVAALVGGVAGLISIARIGRHD